MIGELAGAGVSVIGWLLDPLPLGRRRRTRYQPPPRPVPANPYTIDNPAAQIAMNQQLAPMRLARAEMDSDPSGDRSTVTIEDNATAVARLLGEDR